MPKKSKRDYSISVNGKQLSDKGLKKLLGEESEEQNFIIKEGLIKDGFCNYKFEVIKGVGTGFTHKVDGTGIIDDDMGNAFAMFNVHLACLDDVFKHSGIEISDIDKMHSHDLAYLFIVDGFKIKGESDNESIILIGSKQCSGGFRMEIESPKIPINDLSSYKWYNELKAAADKAREEVALYALGKYTPVEEDEQDKFKQLSIGENENIDEAFENSKV